MRKCFETICLVRKMKAKTNKKHTHTICLQKNAQFDFGHNYRAYRCRTRIWNDFQYRSLYGRIDRLTHNFALICSGCRMKFIPIYRQSLLRQTTVFSWAICILRKTASFCLHRFSPRHDLTCPSTFQIKSYVYVHLLLSKWGGIRRESMNGKKKRK